MPTPAKTVAALAGAALLLSLPVRAQDFTPAVFASIHDEPRDGMGDSFNASPFEGLLREQTTREDRAIQEFDLSSLSGMPITSATISGRITVNNSFDNGPRVFDFLIYEGNGVADLSDFEIPAALIGTDSYQPPTDTTLLFSFDCTAEVQTLLLGGASFIGLKVDCASSPNFPNILTDGDSVLSIATGGTGSAYCFGDGSGTPCPCGNEGDPGRGCANGANAAGAQLVAGGSASLSAGDLVFSGNGLQPGQPGLYFQGDNATGGGQGTAFGDGLRCAGGNVVRLETVSADGAGSSATSVDIGLGGGVAPGDTRRYQLWYRNPTNSPCGSNFNLTNGIELTWTP